MAYEEIRNQVAQEIAVQDSLNNQIGQRWLPDTPHELFTEGEHTKIYLPRLDAKNFDHTIVVASPEQLSHVFDAASELAGGHYLGKDAIIKHETEHGEAAMRLGQQEVRYLARLTIGAPFNLEDGRRVRNVGITPSAVLEDVRASRLGVGLFLGSPEDTADAVEDTKRIQGLGYKDADEVIKRAADFNAKTRTETYPLPRRSS